MTKQLKEFPLDIQISFHKVIEQYEEEVKEMESSISRKYMEEMLSYISDYPELSEGFDDLELLATYREPIKILLDDLFPNILTNNEIKAASIPFHDILFNKSRRLKQILKDAGKDFQLSYRNTDDEIIYIFSCIQILQSCYGYNVDLSRPLYYDIPDENGIQKHYRVAMNADFVEIIKKDNAPEITQQDVDKLLQNVDDLELWKEKFPPSSYLFKGFTIVNLTDVTIDDAISELKTTLLFEEVNETEELQKLQDIFRSIYKISDLRVGFTVYNRRDKVFERMDNDAATSFILDKKMVNDCETGICERGFKKLIDENAYFSISNVDDYIKENNNLLAKNLKDNKELLL